MQREEPDGPEPIHKQVQALIAEAVREGRPLENATLSLSTDAYNRALYQNIPGLRPWSGLADSKPERYLGFPFKIDRKQTEDVMLEHTPTVVNETGISLRVDHLNPHQTTMQVAGQALTKPQLCDLITAYTQGKPNDDFLVALNDAVRLHGRFE